MKKQIVRYTIGETKGIQDYSGLPIFKWKRHSTKRGRILFWAENLFKKRKRLTLAVLVRYGKFENNFGKMRQFTNWGEYENFKDFKSVVLDFSEPSLIKYIQS